MTRLRRYPATLTLALLLVIGLVGSCDDESATKISYKYFPTTAQS